MSSPFLLVARAPADRAQLIPHPEPALPFPMRPPWNLLEVLPGGQNQLCHLGDVSAFSGLPFSAGQGEAQGLLPLPEP